MIGTEWVTWRKYTDRSAEPMAPAIVDNLHPKSLSENRRGLAHFAVPWEQNVPVPLSSAGSRIGSKMVESWNQGIRHKRGSGKEPRTK